MAVHKKSREEIKLMKEAGNIVALVHQEMKRIIEPGVSTKYLDDAAMRIIKENKAIPTFLGYNGFPASICSSVNEQVVHGFPLEDVTLKEGDIISVDVGATFSGLVGDSAWTYAVGDISSYDGKVKLIATGFGEAPTAVNNAMVYINPDTRIQPMHSTSLF